MFGWKFAPSVVALRTTELYPLPRGRSRNCHRWTMLRCISRCIPQDLPPHTSLMQAGVRLSRRRPIDLAAALREHHALGPITGIRAVPNVASQIVAVATAADYRIDPTRWGSAAVAAHFPGFRHLDIRTSGAIIRLRHGGSGPPLLLVHGNPQNHTCWYKVAAKLAEHFHVVLPDLRGYGDSSLPEPGQDNVNFSFREMARDLIEVMQALGHERFMVAGHDRGARTAFRLVLDEPDRVSRLCLMDILPNYHVWTNTTM